MRIQCKKTVFRTPPWQGRLTLATARRAPFALASVDESNFKVVVLSVLVVSVVFE